ncbi:MAG: DUF5133 domain-containing protein [Streptomyces sp.]|nr:DUF5133 domain-containing protein [Streptomyces sp.]NUR66510.1 DUF5133 domain-containing protein [Streptomyces sp.]NUS25449.1 DUF5133 domain-containing protein [Streptomyces sp.]NUS79583.1 DUF5133 domain-containing protein [Streptomyces sp.]
MILPAERELRAALARFAAARIDHDRLATGRSGRALEDATYTLCVLTGARTAADALAVADALLRRYGAEAASATKDKTLAA